MFKISIKAPKFIFDSHKFTHALSVKLQNRVREAAKAFIITAIAAIPVDTGEARGSFLPFGRALNVSFSIPGAKPKPNKNAETGASPEKQLLFTFAANQYGVYLNIDWQLYHFWFNDFFSQNYANGQLPTPWDSIEKGKEAFMLHLKESMGDLPRLKDFITTEYLDSGLVLGDSHGR